jgi:hypothetical protein
MRTAAMQTPPAACRHAATTVRRHVDDGEPLRIYAIGRLAEPARLVADVGEPARLLIEALLHHPQAWPLLVRYAWPDELGIPDANARATLFARTLAEGAEVIAMGRGLEAAHHHGRPVLRLLDPLGLEHTHRLAHAAASATQPQPAEHAPS